MCSLKKPFKTLTLGLAVLFLGNSCQASSRGSLEQSTD